MVQLSLRKKLKASLLIKNLTQLKSEKCVERQWVGEDDGHNNVCNTCLLRVLTILTFFDIIFVASWDVSTDKIQNCNCHKI